MSETTEPKPTTEVASPVDSLVMRNDAGYVIDMGNGMAYLQRQGELHASDLPMLDHENALVRVCEQYLKLKQALDDALEIAYNIDTYGQREDQPKWAEIVSVCDDA
jgi:hypothetical protein